MGMMSEHEADAYAKAISARAAESMNARGLTFEHADTMTVGSLAVLAARCGVSVEQWMPAWAA